MRRRIGIAGALAAAALALLPAVQADDGVIAENVKHLKNVPGTTGGHSVVEGDRLYVGAYGLGMRVFDIKDKANPVEIGRYIPGPQTATLVPGSTRDADPGLRADAVPDAAVIDGKHIVTLNGTGRTAGAQQTEFLDWTDPANPRLLWRFEDALNGEAHNGDIVDERKWWLPSGGGSGLRIYDLQPLLEDEPKAPKLLSMNNPVTLWKESPYYNNQPSPPFTHIHDVTVYTDHSVLLPQAQWTDSTGDGVADKTYAERDIALLAEGGSYLNAAGNTGSVFVVDITDPENPVALLRWTHPAPTGTNGHSANEAHHSRAIRYFHEAQLLDSDPTVMMVTDEDLHNGCEAGGMTVLRLSEDLTSATEQSQWFIGQGTPAPVCSTHVMSTKGPYVYIGAYNAGLQIVDLTDPAQPKRAGRFIAAGANSWGALWHDGVVYVGDFGARGLDVFRFTPPAPPPAP